MRAAHIAAAAVAALLFASFASAQGLGDVAAREKEKRKAESKTGGKVYTESDLGPSMAPASTPVNLPPAVETESSETAGAEGAESAGEGETAAEGETSAGESAGEAEASSAAAQEQEQARAEEAWRRKLEQARKEEQVYQEVIDKLQLDLNDMSGGVYNPGRAARINFLEENKQLLAQTQEKIATLEAEGRSNGYR